MANLGVSVIEVRAGTSDQPVKELRPGNQLAPTSVGRSGMWRVDAPGVLDVHAYVYFDGQALFLQSADPSNPAKSNGQTIGATWTQVEIPCTIEIGRARLVYRTLDDGDDDDKTVARPIEQFDAAMTPAAGSPAAGSPIGAPPAMAFRPGGGALATKTDEEEKTRFAPMDIGGGAPAQRQPEPTVVNPIELSAQAPKARPAAGAPPPAWGDAPGQGSTAAGPPPAPPVGQGWGGNVQVDPNMMQPGMQPGMMQPGMMQPGMMQPGMPMQPGMMPMQPGMSGQLPAQPGPETGKVVTATGPQSPWDKVKKDWQETSFIKKGMLILMPMIGLLMWNLYGNEEPPPQPRDPGLLASEGGVASGGADSGSTAATTGGTVVAPPPLTLPTTTGVIPNPVPALSLDGGQSLTTPKDAGARSPERLAADAVAAGNYALAIQIYDGLIASAQPGPQQDAYKAAAAILRQRLDGG